MQYIVPFVLIIFLIAYFVRKRIIDKRLKELAKTHISTHTTHTWDNTNKRCMHLELLSEKRLCRWPEDHDLNKYPVEPTEEERKIIVKVK